MDCGGDPRWHRTRYAPWGAALPHQPVLSASAEPPLRLGRPRVREDMHGIIGSRDPESVPELQVSDVAGSHLLSPARWDSGL
mgnify:CR=1 FL=1